MMYDEIDENEMIRMKCVILQQDFGLILSGSRHWGSSSHNHFYAGESRGFHQTIHVVRNHHADEKTQKRNQNLKFRHVHSIFI